METRARSVTKGVTWRILATTDTTLLALIFTGSITTALSIGGLEIITKFFLYYGHERLWVWIPSSSESYPFIGKWFGSEKHSRSVIKALSWRLFGAIDTFLIALLFTGQAGTSGLIGVTELITKIFLYYLHDRAWAHIHWGRLNIEHPAPTTEDPSIIQELFVVLRKYRRRGSAFLYALASISFVILSAMTIYYFHR